MTLIAPKSRFRVMLIVITIGVQCMGQTLNEEYRPGSVQRRASNDYVYPHQQSESGIRCKADTYLVEEHRCIENENFFNGKSVTTLSPAILHYYQCHAN